MRWTHWVNFPILAIMIWSGMLIYWANDEYKITIFGHTYVRFFPDWYYNLLHIPQRLAEGMAFHFLFMWFFTLNGFFYVLYSIISGEWRYLLPNKQSFKEAWQVLLHDLHIRKVAPTPTNTMRHSVSPKKPVFCRNRFGHGWAGHLQTGAILLLNLALRRLSFSTDMAFCADDRICTIFPGAYYNRLYSPDGTFSARLFQVLR